MCSADALRRNCVTPTTRQVFGTDYRGSKMQKEYGCNELMVDGGYCTSVGDVVCLCDVCQRKIIEKIELLEGAKNTEQQVQADSSTPNSLT